MVYVIFYGGTVGPFLFRLPFKYVVLTSSTSIFPSSVLLRRIERFMSCPRTDGGQRLPWGIEG